MAFPGQSIHHRSLPSSELPPNPRALWKLLRKTKGNPGPIPRIAEALGVSEPTVKRSLATLVAAGMVGIEDHGCHPNTYKLSTWRQISVTFGSVDSGRLSDQLLDQNDPTIGEGEESSTPPGSRGAPKGPSRGPSSQEAPVSPLSNSDSSQPTDHLPRFAGAPLREGRLPSLNQTESDYFWLFLGHVEDRDGPGSVTASRKAKWIPHIRALVARHPREKLWEMTRWLFVDLKGKLPYAPRFNDRLCPDKARITRPGQILFEWDGLVAYRSYLAKPVVNPIPLPRPEEVYVPPPIQDRPARNGSFVSGPVRRQPGQTGPGDVTDMSTSIQARRDRYARRLEGNLA